MREDEDGDYGEANPFAAETPDWLVEDAEPEATEPFITPLVAAPAPPEAEDVVPKAGASAAAPVTEQPPAAPAGAVAIPEAPVTPAAQRLRVTMCRSHSLDADRRRLSDLVDLLEKYEGTDRFIIMIEAPGQASYQLDFPNSQTRICKELRAELSQRLGVNHWRVE